MNNKTKKFLLLLTAIAFVGWIGVNFLLGPPGLSSEYLDKNGSAHERYLEVIKSDEYKHYAQRPAHFDLESNPELKRRVELVDAYVANEAYQSEQHRIHLYALFFELFNAALVVILVVRLAKAPLIKFLDEQIEELREKISQAARSRKSAQGRRAAVEEKIAHIHEEELKVSAATERRLERELAELAEANHYSYGLHERELTERKKAEEHAMELALKRQLVDQAIAGLVEEVESGHCAERHDHLIAQFCDDVEAKA